MSIVVGYVAAASRAGLARTSLRRLVAKGQLAASKRPDGTWTFQEHDLDALRAARASTAIAPTVATPCASTAVAVGGTVPTGEIPAFLLRAVEDREDAGADDEDDGDGAAESGQTAHQHEPPFWASAATTPTYPDGEPYVDVATGRICYRQVPTSTAPHAPGAPAAVMLQLQVQLVELQSQLAAVTTAWRRDRAAAIAAEIVVEAIMAGAMLQVVPAVRDAAHAAAASLTNDELRREDGYPQAVARGAGMAAAQQLGAAIAWQAQQPWASPHDGFARAPMRRSPSRSPRW